MADPEIDAIRALLVARPRPADLSERRERLDCVACSALRYPSVHRMTNIRTFPGCAKVRGRPSWLLLARRTGVAEMFWFERARDVSIHGPLTALVEQVGKLRAGKRKRNQSAPDPGGMRDEMEREFIARAMRNSR